MSPSCHPKRHSLVILNEVKDPRWLMDPSTSGASHPPLRMTHRLTQDDT